MVLSAAAAMAVAIWQMRRRQCLGSGLSPEANTIPIQPGVVLIKHAIDSSTQSKVTGLCFTYGHERGKFYDGDQLNSWRQGRARAYDAIDSIEPSLRHICRSLVDAAVSVDPLVAPQRLDHTHLLLLYYTSKGIGWHRDDGPNDGQSDEAVVSLSLGASCSFSIKNEEQSPPTTLTLESGDAILFGGPSKRILHTVRHIRPETCPKVLKELRPPGLAKYSDAFRLNLTWRHAPELRGLEDSDRFFHFGAPTRLFLDAQRSHGTDTARQLAADRRAAKRRTRSERRAPAAS